MEAVREEEGHDLLLFKHKQKENGDENKDNDEENMN